MARALRGSGSVTARGVPASSKAVDKHADQGGAVAAVDHVLLADELVDAARSARVLAQAVVGPRGRVVALQIGERPVAERDDKLVHGRVIEVSADQSQLLVRIAPPLRDVRHRQPAPNHRQVCGRHQAKRADARHHGSRVLQSRSRGANAIARSASVRSIRKQPEFRNDGTRREVAHAGYTAGGSRSTRAEGNGRRKIRRSGCQPTPSTSTKAPRINSVAKKTTTSRRSAPACTAPVTA